MTAMSRALGRTVGERLHRLGAAVAVILAAAGLLLAASEIRNPSGAAGERDSRPFIRTAALNPSEREEILRKVALPPGRDRRTVDDCELLRLYVSEGHWMTAQLPEGRLLHLSTPDRLGAGRAIKAFIEEEKAVGISSHGCERQIRPDGTELVVYPLWKQVSGNKPLLLPPRGLSFTEAERHALLERVRSEYIDYRSKDDGDLTNAIRQRFYPQMSSSEFEQRLGLKPPRLSRVMDLGKPFLLISAAFLAYALTAYLGRLLDGAAPDQRSADGAP
jgi:hypothetical protein